MNKWKKIVCIILFPVVAVLILLAALTYIVGVSEPDADPMAVLEPYLEFVKIPNLQPAPEN